MRRSVAVNQALFQSSPQCSRGQTTLNTKRSTSDTLMNPEEKTYHLDIFDKCLDLKHTVMLFTENKNLSFTSANPMLLFLI